MDKNNTNANGNSAFICYSHKDSTICEELKTYLMSIEGKFEFCCWDDTKIISGDWRKKIDEALDRSKIGILLVSQDFLDSDFIRKYELPRLLETAKKAGKRILWIPIKTSMYKQYPAIESLQALIDPKKPLKDMTAAKRAKAFVEIADKIFEYLKDENSELEKPTATQALNTETAPILQKPGSPPFKMSLGGKTFMSDNRILDLSYRNINNISALAACANLADLDLCGNQISDITPLASFTDLVHLNLWTNQISDIMPLASLINLTDLALQHNQISDITPFASLTKLTFLYLSSNQIYDIAPLASLNNLTDLNLIDNQISGITPLAGLTKLTFLYLSSNQISDITPLAGLTNLTHLNISYNQISDIAPLASLTNLTYLELMVNQISNITPLASLTNLTYLELMLNQISDITPLKGLSNLKALYLRDNDSIARSQIDDLKKTLPNCRITAE